MRDDNGGIVLDANSDVPNVLLIGSHRKCVKKQHTARVRNDKTGCGGTAVLCLKETLTCFFFV